MPVEWVDPDTFEAVVGEMPTVAQFNSVLQDLKYLYETPGAAMRLTGAQSVADATDHPVEWDEAVWDSHGDMWDVGAPSTVTITRDGLYAVHLSTLWEASADDNERSADLEVNGTLRRDFYTVSASVAQVAMSTGFVTNLADGDDLEVIVRQNSGSAQDLIQTRTVLTVVWVRAAPATGE